MRTAPDAPPKNYLSFKKVNSKYQVGKVLNMHSEEPSIIVELYILIH